MNKLTGILFCVVTLALTLAAMWALFPHAAMSKDHYNYAFTPQEPELFDDISVKDFGDVSVLDMVLHYIEEPPEEANGLDNKVRFQGC